jgi:hypothetical protein
MIFLIFRDIIGALTILFDFADYIIYDIADFISAAKEKYF